MPTNICTIKPIRAAVSSSGGTPPPNFLEDFSEYANITQLRNNTYGKFTARLDGSNDGNETEAALQISIDSGSGLNIDGYNLQQCLLMSFPAIAQADYSIQSNFALGADYNEIWAEMYVMFSSNFTTDGPVKTGAGGAPINEDYKFNAARTRVSGRYMTFCGTFGDGWQFGTPFSDEGFNSDVPGLYGNSDDPFTNSVAVWDGTWHRYRYHLKNSASGGAIFFIDNFRMPSFPIGTVDTSGGGAIWSWSLGRNMNQGTFVPMTVRWGRYAAWNTNPGWGF